MKKTGKDILQNQKNKTYLYFLYVIFLPLIVVFSVLFTYIYELKESVIPVKLGFKYEKNIVVRDNCNIVKKSFHNTIKNKNFSIDTNVDNASYMILENNDFSFYCEKKENKMVGIWKGHDNEKTDIAIIGNKGTVKNLPSPDSIKIFLTENQFNEIKNSIQE